MTRKWTRRAFISIVTALAAGAWTSTGCGNPDEENLEVVLNADNGVALLQFSKGPALREVGGQLFFSIMDVPDKLIAIRTKADELRVVSRICTHKGCALSYISSLGRLECPCHGSLFETTGAVVTGPATKPLKSYSVSFDIANDFAMIFFEGLS